jgi:glycosyltransferase involved in cell wall biosynthesis
MKLLYIADGRSPTALNWIGHFIQGGHEVHLVSTYQCESVPGLASMQVVPVGLSEFYSLPNPRRRSTRSILRKILPVELRTRIRQLAAPFSLPRAASRINRVIERVQPDLIHAMRIPYEGMIAAESLEKISRNAYQPHYPLLISVWGNDFTLHARSTAAMWSYTRRVLRAASGLHTDCQRDQRLALEMGFEAAKPNIVLPGGGGVRMDIFYPRDRKREDEGDANAPVSIINPRGIRAYVRNDTIFQAIRLVAEKHPDVHIFCPGMQDEAQALQWAIQFCIMDKLELLPLQSRHQMAKLFRRSQITLSITTHDGTPNTLLEAMACGCFPIASDIESIREWITPGENGLLVEPGDPEALAKAILEAIGQPRLCRQARERNLKLIGERAEYGKCMKEADKFYKHLISPGA